MSELNLSFSDFSGGQASTFPFLKMPPKFGTLFKNCHVSDGGGVAKIPGYVKINTSPGNGLKTGFEYRKKNGTVQILCAGGGIVYKQTGVTLTAIKTGLNVAAKVWFAQFSDYVVFGNGIDPPQKYDGTTVTALAGLPTDTTFSKPHVHAGRLWWMDNTNRMMAYHSAVHALEDYTSADAAGYIDFSFILPKGEALQDILTFVDLQVFLFKNYVLIYAGTDPTTGGDYRLVQSISGVGAVGPGTATEIGTDLLFIHSSGIKSLRQVVATGNMELGKNISSNIEADIRREIQIDTVNEYAVCHYASKSWVLFLINGSVWIYSYLWKAWGRMVGGDVSGMFGMEDGKLYLCGGLGYLYEYGVGYSFDGEVVTMAWEGPWLRFSHKGYPGYPTLMEIVFGKGVEAEVTTMVRYDLAPVSPENMIVTSPGITMMDEAMPGAWDGTMYLDSPFAFVIERVPLFGGGKAVQVIFNNISTVGPVEWNNITILATRGNEL
jgi:hypothetical protein